MRAQTDLFEWVGLWGGFGKAGIGNDMLKIYFTKSF